MGASIDLRIGSILDSSIFPKNLRVRWIAPGFVHRTSARLDFKPSWTSPTFLRIGPGISMARKDRINQRPLTISPSSYYPLRSANDLLTSGGNYYVLMLTYLSKKSMRKARVSTNKNACPFLLDRPFTPSASYDRSITSSTDRWRAAHQYGSHKTPEEARTPLYPFHKLP